MKPAAMSVVSLLFLLLLIEASQGIRFDDELIASFHKITQEKQVGVEDALGGVPCKDDGLCSGRSRKLMEKATAKPKSEQSNEKEVGHLSKEEVDKKESHGDINVEPPKTYPDVLDIAGMDYSPAKRKPPIHN